MSKQPKGLGRGLGALLGDFTEPAAETHCLPIQSIEPNPLQPRKTFDEEELQQLADSIREHGIIQPLAVRPVADGYYQIIAGERRWQIGRASCRERV